MQVLAQSNISNLTLGDKAPERKARALAFAADISVLIGFLIGRQHRTALKVLKAARQS